MLEVSHQDTLLLNRLAISSWLARCSKSGITGADTISSFGTECSLSPRIKFEKLRNMFTIKTSELEHDIP